MYPPTARRECYVASEVVMYTYYHKREQMFLFIEKTSDLSDSFCVIICILNYLEEMRNHVMVRKRKGTRTHMIKLIRLIYVIIAFYACVKSFQHHESIPSLLTLVALFVFVWLMIERSIKTAV